MSRRFKTADYAPTLEVTVRWGDCLPPEHLARFVVDAIAQLDLGGLYARYSERGGEAYAPEILVGVLFYGYATGVFSSRKIERATYWASASSRCVAWRPPRANGAWSAWPSISSDCIPSWQAMRAA